MELEFKPGKFALNRNTLETVIIKEVKDDRILIISVDGSREMWADNTDYNLFKRKDNKWTVEGPPIYRSEGKVGMEMQEKTDTNISERFK